MLVILKKKTITMGDAKINSSANKIQYDYVIKFLALGDSGVGMLH